MEGPACVASSTQALARVYPQRLYGKQPSSPLRQDCRRAPCPFLLFGVALTEKGQKLLEPSAVVGP